MVMAKAHAGYPPGLCHSKVPFFMAFPNQQQEALFNVYIHQEAGWERWLSR
jgi:hypothetical protein